MAIPALIEPSSLVRPKRADVKVVRTVSVRGVTKKSLYIGAALYPEQPGVDYHRPKTRADCADGPRPCPYVSCKYHLKYEINPVNGSIRDNQPGVDIEDMDHSCVLDVVDANPDGLGLVELGKLLMLTKERVRQILGSISFKIASEHHAEEFDVSLVGARNKSKTKLEDDISRRVKWSLEILADASDNTPMAYVMASDLVLPATRTSDEVFPDGATRKTVMATLYRSLAIAHDTELCVGERTKLSSKKEGGRTKRFAITDEGLDYIGR